MSSFSYEEVAAAPIYGGGRYFEPGTYRLRIEESKVIDSQKSKGIQFLIVACEVLEYLQEDPEVAPKLRAGDKVSWRVKMSQPSAMSNMKQWALACGQALYEPDDENPDGFTERDVDAAFLKSLLEEEEAKDLVICAFAQTIKTAAGNPFTKVTWYAPTEAPQKAA